MKEKNIENKVKYVLPSSLWMRLKNPVSNDAANDILLHLRAIHSVASHPLEHGESNSNLGSRHHFC